MSPRILECNSGSLPDRPRSRGGLRTRKEIKYFWKTFIRRYFAFETGFQPATVCHGAPPPQYRLGYVFIGASIFYAPFVVTGYFPCTSGN